MKSVMEHNYAQVPRADIQRSSFDLSHGYKTTFDADYLIPICVMDIIPGDTFNLNCNFFARLATPLYPIMDNLHMDQFWFFTPYRLVWDNWEKMMGAQTDPGDSIDYTTPTIGRADDSFSGPGTLFDYFGLPDLVPDDIDVSALPFRAYSLIFNEWFRDQDLQDSYNVQTDDGPDSFTTTPGWDTFPNPIKRGKRHDYFTSCRPWPQKGDAVDLPLGTSADIFIDKATAALPSFAAVDDNQGVVHTLVTTHATNVEVAAATGTEAEKLKVDLTNATAATINDIRLAFQTQRLLERDARSGTRYIETIKAHYGVTVPDFRLQRPEFLGGGSTPFNINAVANTSDTTNANQGDLAAFGTVSGQNGFTKSFVEHGVLIGLANVRGDITYSQGIHRMWHKSTRYHFYYPVFAGIGEQAVLNSEIWADGSANDDLVFGYQERYGEYRFHPSRLTGLFRPDAVGTLAAWHLSEDFATLPTLGDTFIQSNTGTPLDRAIAVPSEPHVIADFHIGIRAARPLPLFGVPGSLDHF